ncbi:MAG: peptide chain release factor N(5)-glutamine methyltransferase [Proteobacteria bacterium]|nr:peptide chain release factor N(5)-glutamine methyltransferase [Pseudomonadota bacterium]
MVEKTVQSALAEMRAQFKSSGVETPELDARLLLQGALGLSHEELVLNVHRTLTESDSATLAGMILRRILREPVSRILGVRAFWKSEFKVSPDTLDPRADSETLIEAVLVPIDKESPVSILDLGTGTGCLLLSLLQELPQATGVGVDISLGAIRIAQQNAEALSLADRSLFITSNWATMPLDRQFNIIVSNPPYIIDTDIINLQPEVSLYDPRSTLSGGVDGLDCYRSIAQLLPGLLAERGKVFLEIGATQAESVKEILAKAGLCVLQTVTDIAGRDRCVVAQCN